MALCTLRDVVCNALARNSTLMGACLLYFIIQRSLEMYVQRTRVIVSLGRRDNARLTHNLKISRRYLVDHTDLFDY